MWVWKHTRDVAVKCLSKTKIIYTVPIYFEQELDLLKERYTVDIDFKDTYIILTVVKPVDNDDDKTDMK